MTYISKYNRENVTKLLREDLKNSKEKNKKVKVFLSLKYLVIFPNENDHKCHCKRETAAYIQPVDVRVTGFTCKQTREACRVPKDIQSRA